MDATNNFPGNFPGAPVMNGAPPMPDRNAPRKTKKKKNTFLWILRKLLTVIITTLLSLFLVMVITGTIVATALTVYVLDFMDDSTGVTLQELEAGNDTYFYGYETDENGEQKLVVLNRVKSQVQRIPVTIDRIPQHVRDAFVYTEDERFYTHDGVDYKRTFSAFVNMFMHIYDTEQGGSTITQQLIKNITGDDEHSPQRKIREIFSAMQLEKTYSKDQILEEYLNYIGFGGPINGIQLASIRYFGKSVEELTVPEAAVLAAIPKSPEEYGPFVEYHEDNDPRKPIVIDGRANNKTRQRYVLYKLYDNGVISYDDYQAYLNTKLMFTDSPEYLAAHPEDTAEELEKEESAYSWVVDAMYFEAADFFAKEFNTDRADAIERINRGGYKIYSSVDDQMQKYVENVFLDLNNFLDPSMVIRYVDLDDDGELDECVPHVGFIALNYDGTVKSLIGDWGEKKDSLITNYAVDEPRAVGSTMKPVSTYGLALETDHIHYGSVYTDKTAAIVDGQPWPTNYSIGTGLNVSGEVNKIYYFLLRSFNTVPAQLCVELTPAAVYKFCTEQMGLELVDADCDLAPLTVGALTRGVTLKNLANAYLPYGNEGIYNEAHIITKIEDSNHEIVYQNDGNPHRAVSDETAWVMNRMLKNVIEDPWGTGAAARLQNKVLVAKTGTTENWWDLTFVGLTRDYVSAITIGYKQLNENLQLPTSLSSAAVWKAAIGEYTDKMFLDTPADFDPVESVISEPMCSITGMRAGPNCPRGPVGYWKSTNCPVCDGSHGYVQTGGASNGNGNNTGNGTGNATGNSTGTETQTPTPYTPPEGHVVETPVETPTEQQPINEYGDPNANTGGDTGANTGGDAGANAGGDTGET